MWVIIILAYIFIGVVVGTAVHYFSKDFDSDFGAAVGTLWILMVPIILLILALVWVHGYVIHILDTTKLSKYKRSIF